ncbi:MAG: hypothetical protein ABSG88_05965 [Bradyrhizobium sp.]
MSRMAIRLSMLTLCATALVLVPAAAKTGHRGHMHIKKHRHHFRVGWPAGPTQPVAGYYAPSEPICPAIGKSFDCKIWPPPYADDPDRKTSRY